jgi:deoxyuridine 5'-triphosphate nucleotidohydrolase
MTEIVFNFASLVLDRIRSGLLNNKVENSSRESMIDDALNGRKVTVTGEDEETKQNLIDLFAMKFVKLRPDAVVPTKATDGSVGFDLTLLGLKSVCAEDPNVFYFHTGLKVKPPPGYYTKIFPRSSIIKSGFSLANSVGIIDVDYRGELLVALRRERADATLTFPCKVTQLLPELDHSHIISIEVEDLDNTARGEGGFGSTGK